MKKAIISTEVLDKIWNNWLSTQPLTNYERQWVLGRPFGGVESRRSNKKVKFENWLFSRGGSIRRINKKFYIEFSDPAQATYFMLVQ